jgi:phosphohistidine phosphatase
MKRLLILRHAKSDRSDPSLTDHDRPLAPRGEVDAPRMGAALAALGIAPDRILTSTAVRARDTARLVATALGYDAPLRETREAYAADSTMLLRLICAEAEDAETLLLVGHNPGMEELASLLVAGEGIETGIRMPTAALACLTIDTDDWQDMTPGSGTLQWLLTPRIVAPLLSAGQRPRNQRPHDS